MTDSNSQIVAMQWTHQSMRRPERTWRLAEYRVLFGALAISMLVHAWLLLGAPLGGGYSRSGTDSGTALLHLALVPDGPSERDEPVPRLGESLTRSAPLAAERLPALEPTASHDASRALAVEDVPANLSSMTTPNPDRVEVKPLEQEPMPASRPDLRSERAIPDARGERGSRAQHDRSLIATADQYRVALVLQARREREQLAVEAEGRTRVRLSFASGGALESANVVTSSGSDELDAEALRLFERARAMLPVPAALHAKQFSIEATVSFERN